MNNDEIQLIKNKRNDFNYKIKQLEEYKKRILELEQDPVMKEYYNLKTFVENNRAENFEKQMKKDIDKIVIYTNNSNKILYDYGLVSVITYEGYSSDDTEYSLEHVYRDLETTEYYFETFDEICLMPPEWRVCSFVSNAEYDALRNYFIEQIQSKPQDDIICELLEKNKKLIKGK